MQSIAMLEAFPLAGCSGRIPNTRELPIPRLPFFAVYRIGSETELFLLAIVLTSRQWPPDEDQAWRVPKNPCAPLERVLFSWKQSEWMNFSHLTRRRPQSDAVASVEDFDDVRAEKTPPAVR
jgi:hypothetical protein